VIVQIKENQEKLLLQCRSVTQDYNPKGVHASRDKGHGRQEERRVRSFSIPDHMQAWFRSRGWKDVAMIVHVERVRSVFDTQAKVWRRSREESHYVSTIPLFAKEFAEGIRDHWGIENRNHHVRDVTLGEDASRIRKNPEIMVKLRSAALNLLRTTGARNIRQARFAFGLRPALLLAHHRLIDER
jgi:predicted transposase YbfD/YdcC